MTGNLVTVAQVLIQPQMSFSRGGYRSNGKAPTVPATTWTTRLPHNTTSYAPDAAAHRQARLPARRHHRAAAGAAVVRHQDRTVH
jgi:hypothetical protein